MRPASGFLYVKGVLRDVSVAVSFRRWTLRQPGLQCINIVASRVNQAESAQMCEEKYFCSSENNKKQGVLLFSNTAIYAYE